jgi:hypothetical protein
VKVDVAEGQKAKYLKWELVIGVGDYKGSKLFMNTSLSPNSLWNLRNTLVACGLQVPKSVMQLDTDKLPGNIIGVTVGHETYENKERAKVADVWRPVKTEKGYQRAAGGVVSNAPKAAPKAKAPEKVTNYEPIEDEDVEVSDDIGGLDDVEEIEL